MAGVGGRGVQLGNVITPFLVIKTQRPGEAQAPQSKPPGRCQGPQPRCEGCGARTVRDRDDDLAHELRLLWVGVLPVQHDVGGSDLACAAVKAVEFVGWLDAVHQGAVLSQVWVYGHHLSGREETDPPLSPAVSKLPARVV